MEDEVVGHNSDSTSKEDGGGPYYKGDDQKGPTQELYGG